MLEVYGGVGEARGSRDPAGLEEFALPFLRGGMVDLEDVETRVGVAVGEGVQAGSEQDIDGREHGELRLVESLY